MLHMNLICTLVPLAPIVSWNWFSRLFRTGIEKVLSHGKSCGCHWHGDCFGVLSRWLARTLV